MAELRTRLSKVTAQEDLPNEEWLDIKDYEGLYQVSNMGRVRRIPNGKIKIFKIAEKYSSYQTAHLSKNGVSKICKVHRLVAQAFIPNPENKPSVNHIDVNKWNNRADNLEWVDQKENTLHAIRLGLRDYHQPNKNCRKLTPEDVRYIRKNYKRGDKEFVQKALARKFGVTKNSIYQIITNGTYTDV